MDFTSLNNSYVANDGAKLELRSLSGGPLLKEDKSPITITLLGADSDAYTRLSNQLTNGTLRKGFRAGTVTAESSLADRVALLVACTVAWDGVGLGEDSSPCTPENARRLYMDFPFIREQVEGFVNDRGNFVSTSPRS